MAPPRSTPRLVDLDPAAVAAAAVAVAAAQLNRLAFALSPGVELHGPLEPQATQLWLTVALLTRYAQRGGAVGDWEGDGEALDAIQEVLSTLYVSAADRHSAAVLNEHEGDLDDSDAMTVVLLAAWCRVQLGQGHGVTLRELAAISGLTGKVVHGLVAAGELRASGERPAKVTAKEARRWLSGRGVVGFGKE